MSTRNFDASVITAQRQAQTSTRGIFVAQTTGARIVSNPQTSDPSASLIGGYHVGSESAYIAGTVGGKGQTILGATLPQK